MRSDSDFEDRLSLALRRYADEVVQPFDADEIVERAVGTPRRAQRFSVFGPSLAPLTLIATLLLLLALTIAAVVLTAPEELPVRGLIVSGDSGVTVVDGTESFTLVSDEHHERIAWAYPDQRGGIIYQHEVTPEPWPPGAVMWLPAGATQPQLLAEPAQGPTLDETWIAPVGTVISGSGRALFLYLSTEVPAEEGSRYLSRLMAADLDSQGEHHEVTAWLEDGSFEGRYGVVAGGDAVALIHHLTRHDTSGEVCATVTLLSVDDGSSLLPSDGCLEGAWRRWESALGYDGRTLAGWDADASRFMARNLLTGEIVEDIVIQVPPSAFWERPVPTPDGWLLLLHHESDVVLLDLAGREALRVVVPGDAGWSKIPYFDALRLSQGARLGSGSSMLPCQPSDGEHPGQDLPEPVAATRQVLFHLASSCDYSGLARLARAHRTVLFAEDGWGPSADRSDGTLARAWVRHAVARPEPLTLLAELLGAEPVYVAEFESPGTPGDIQASDVWVWPGNARTRDDLVVISSDGTWRYYLPWGPGRAADGGR
jgi:hypothetical protein